MVNPIGGYFELELPQSKKKFPHSDGMLLNSGRHSLEYILRSMKNVGRLWIPYFTCYHGSPFSNIRKLWSMDLA